VKGSLYTTGQLDTMEIAVNRPIRNKIVNKYLNTEVRAQLQKLREEKKVEEFRKIADQVRNQIETEYNLQTGILEFSEEQRKAYTTIGGYPIWMENTPFLVNVFQEWKLSTKLLH
jgi:hypothetical protein